MPSAPKFKLVVENYLGCRRVDISLEVGKVSYLRGMNAAGKSSVATAAMALATRCADPLRLGRYAGQYTHNAGADGDVMIYVGNDEGRIEWRGGAVFDEIGDAILPPLPEGMRELPELLAGRVARPAGVWQHLLGATPTEAQLREELERIFADETAGAVSPELQGAVDDVLAAVAIGAAGDADDRWKVAEDEAAARAISFKREIEQGVAKTLGLKISYGARKVANLRHDAWEPECENMTIAAAEAAVDEARAAEARWRREADKDAVSKEIKDKAAEEIRALEPRLARLNADHSKASVDWEAAHAALTAAKQAGGDPEKDDEVIAARAALARAKEHSQSLRERAERYSDRRERGQRAKTEIDQAAREIERLEAEAADVREQLESGEGPGVRNAFCPWCEKPMLIKGDERDDPREVERAITEGVIAGRRERVQDLGEAIGIAKERIGKANERLIAVDNESDQDTEPEPRADDMAKAAAAVEAAENAIADRLAALAKPQAVVAAEIAERDAARKKRACEQRVADVEAAMEANRRILKKEIANPEAGQRRVLAAETLRVAEGMLAAIRFADWLRRTNRVVIMWESVRALLKPAGLRASIAEGKRDRLNKLVESFTDRVHGISLDDWPTMELGADWRFMVGGRPAVTAAGSEHWLARAAVTCALTKMWGGRLAVLDGLDILYDANKAEEALAGIAERGGIALLVTRTSRNLEDWTAAIGNTSDTDKCLSDGEVAIENIV